MKLCYGQEPCLATISGIQHHDLIEGRSTSLGHCKRSDQIFPRKSGAQQATVCRHISLITLPYNSLVLRILYNTRDIADQQATANPNEAKKKRQQNELLVEIRCMCLGGLSLGQCSTATTYR